MRRERLRRSITLEELARSAHIPVHYLEALENSDYDNLPPKPYVKGFLLAFARHLSLPPAEVYGLFEESFQEFQRQGKDEGSAIFALFRPQGDDRFHWRDWLIPLALAAGVLLVLASRWFIGGDGPAGQPPASPSVERADEPWSFPNLSEEAVEEGPPSEGAEPVGVRVVVRAEATTWLSVERDGGEGEEWSMRAGEERDLTARERLVLSLGNAGAVRINYNGREMGFIGQKGEVKRGLVFTPEEE